MLIPMSSRLRILLFVCLVLVGFASIMLQQVWARQTSTPNPFEITTTYIVGMATFGAQTRFSSTELTSTGEAYAATQLLITPNLFEITATYIFGMATRQAHFTPTPVTPTPAPRPTHDYPAFTAYYRQMLIQAVGFDHPVFDEVVDRLVGQLTILEENGGLSLIGDSFQPEVARVTFEGTEYIVVLAQDQMLEYANRILVFRLESGPPALIPLPALPQPMGIIFSFTPWSFLARQEQIGEYGFADRNNNGFPDIAIYSTTGGNHPIRATVVLEMQAGSQLVVLDD